MRGRKKKGSPLTLGERTIIEVRYRDGTSLRNIAKELNRNVSSISREIAGKPHKELVNTLLMLLTEKLCKELKKEVMCPS